MKHPRFSFFQGSTPTLAFSLPYALSAEDELYATFSQEGSTVTEYTYPPIPDTLTPTGTLSPDDGDPCVVRIALTQADTFLFAPGDCTLQLRVKKSNGSADTLFPVQGYVGKAQKEAVI